MKDMYTEKVKCHFLHPRNVGEINNPDGVGTVGNPTCGDIMTIYIKVKDDRIIDIKFKTFGCAAAIASTSVATEMVKGKKIDEAYKLTRDDVAKEFGAKVIRTKVGEINRWRVSIGSLKASLLQSRSVNRP